MPWDYPLKYETMTVNQSTLAAPKHIAEKYVRRLTRSTLSPNRSSKLKLWSITKKMKNKKRRKIDLQSKPNAATIHAVVFVLAAWRTRQEKMEHCERRTKDKVYLMCRTSLNQTRFYLFFLISWTEDPRCEWTEIETIVVHLETNRFVCFETCLRL